VSRLDGFPEAVNALTREQVNGAIKNHLDPAIMVVVKAGSVAPAVPEHPLSVEQPYRPK
jgi:predicted Zn-dependent peptidase